MRRHAEEGSELLDKFRHQRQKLEELFDPPKPAASITRMMAGARVKLEAEIKRTARVSSLFIQKSVVQGVPPDPKKTTFEYQLTVIETWSGLWEVDVVSNS